jgi:hypothetical protein
MRATRALVFAVLMGCGGAEPPPPVNPIAINEVQQVANEPPAPPCIKQPEETAAIRHADASGTRVSYCVGTAIDQCFSLDLARGTLTRLAEAPAGQSRALDRGARVETTNPELKVCTESTGCKTLTPQVWPGAAPLRAATNGNVAAVMLGDSAAGKGYVDVYDVLRTKKLATFRYARGVFKCGDVAMLGETIYVNATVCTAPSGRAALYTVKGRKLANVGGKPDFGTFGGAYTQVDGTTWAFLEENGNKIALQDVAKGKVVKAIDVSELFANAGARMGNPGESAIVRLGDGKLAVIAGSPANGSVAVVDPATGELSVTRAPLCD